MRLAAGLEKALVKADDFEIDLAIRRILLIHGVTFSFGGIPLIYLGDEIGMLNDDGYRDHTDKAGDSRWAHRPTMNWAKPSYATHRKGYRRTSITA